MGVATLAVVLAVLALAGSAGAAGFDSCKGQATAPNGLGLTDLKAKKVSCGLARKTMRKWGRVWEKSGYEQVVKFRRGYRWRCAYRDVTRQGVSFGQVKCAAKGQRRVKFNVRS